MNDIISHAFLSPKTLNVADWEWHRLQIQGNIPKARSSDMVQEHCKGREIQKLCHDVPNSWPIEHPSAKRGSHGMEPILFDISQEKIMLVRKPFVVTANFLYDAVRVHAKWALSIVITQAPTVQIIKKKKVNQDE
jgi:hypothetical protein